MKVFETWRALADLGILGINRRNTEYTLRWNPRRFYPRVDDKLLTKELCESAGIPTARLLGVARRMGDLQRLVSSLAEHRSFVLKPAHGAMGNGILVIRSREGDRLQRAGGSWIGIDEFVHHASGILSGLYALGGQPDAAFVEERLEVHPELVTICADGVPDLRVIVFRGVPAMAMTRLPTRRSRGRANLHQGAVGAGVDLASGRTRHAVIGTQTTRFHPDTGEPVLDRAIPGFAEALEIAVRATDLTGLGYVGADVVVDARHGPLILELNARPGLAIQIANRQGLLGRLQGIERAWQPDMDLATRLELGRRLAREAGDTRTQGEDAT
ncbi:MAG: alpha-L-glutamate ligase-like protein [Myxococcota bacterium]